MSLYQPSGWLPGMTLDFAVAIAEVRDKVGHSFQQGEWNTVLYNIINDWLCDERKLDYGVNVEYSLMYIHVEFLNTLWRELYGRLGRPSPWALLDPMLFESNTKSDIVLEAKPLLDHLLHTTTQDDFIQVLASGKIPDSKESVKDEDEDEAPSAGSSSPETAENESEDDLFARQPPTYRSTLRRW
ncbi:hypothetical protein PFICI_12639 [Pestalotiopsis fici W106-1]|uniref:Uncharacterized protein n=1 Tax=Pestalotiopsis fici (strain W106-1 / CGMCC3.15140) TaxID=1229662 RepID=W3WP69_PESFW|nr:uncharacterized protein PFICI_12639 [Pestalotiopsis fici W106-1]ETS75695.1 hypothetical protein PFICI_12639 [Pestalotiopsis fici W106-1]